MKLFKIKFVFFGSSDFSIHSLSEFENAGFIPSLIVTTPDKPKGRGLALSKNPVKKWAEARGILTLNPLKLDSDFICQLQTTDYQLFIVASYGKIIPKSVLDIPEAGSLNIHPSLLPKYRGPSPIQSAILADDRNVGVSIIEMDEKMDHGPVVAKESLTLSDWPPRYKDLERDLAIAGAKLLIKIIPDWLSGKTERVLQDESLATYAKKFEKKDGFIDLSENSWSNFLKIRALAENSGVYFFADRRNKKIRVKIIDAEWKDGKLKITRVIPEGKHGMSYEEFMRGAAGAKK